MSHQPTSTCSGSRPLHFFLAMLPALLIAWLLAGCGTAAPPRAAQPAQPASDAKAPTMAKAPTSAGQQPSAQAQAGASGDPRGLGDPEAPITIVEYSDYQ